MKGEVARYTLRHFTIDVARLAALVLVLVSPAALRASGSASSAAPAVTDNPVPSTPSGPYTLTTADGKGLPVAVFAEGSYTYEVTNGSLALANDGKYKVVTTVRQTLPGSVSTFVDSTGGTWVKPGTSIQLTNGQDRSLDPATWD